MTTRIVQLYVQSIPIIAYFIACGCCVKLQDWQYAILNLCFGIAGICMFYGQYIFKTGG